MAKSKNEGKPDTKRVTIGSVVLIAVFVFLVAPYANMTGINPLSAIGIAMLIAIAVSIGMIIESWIDGYILWGSWGETIAVTIVALIITSVVADTIVTMALGMKILLILVSYFSSRIQRAASGIFGF